MNKLGGRPEAAAPMPAISRTELVARVIAGDVTDATLMGPPNCGHVRMTVASDIASATRAADLERLLTIEYPNPLGYRILTFALGNAPTQIPLPTPAPGDHRVPPHRTEPALPDDDGSASVALASDEHELVGGSVVSEGRYLADAVAKRIAHLKTHVLQLLGATDGGWSHLYRDPQDGRLWESTYPQGELHGGGPQRLRQLTLAAAQERYGAGMIAQE